MLRAACIFAPTAARMIQNSVKTLTIICLAMFATSSVQASCGDYLYTKHSKPMHASEHGKTEAAPATESKPQPCSGPHCRQKQDFPQRDLPVIGSSVSANDGLTPAKTIAPGANRSAMRVREVAPSQRRGFPLRMLRPPEFTV